MKLGLQFAVSMMVGMWLLLLTAGGMYSTQLMVPFFKRVRPDLLIHGLMTTATPRG